MLVLDVVRSSSRGSVSPAHLVSSEVGRTTTEAAFCLMQLESSARAGECLQIERLPRGSKQCKVFTCLTGGGDFTSAFEKDSLIGGTTRGRARPAACKRLPKLSSDVLEQQDMLR